MRARWIMVFPSLALLAALSYSAIRMGAADAITWMAGERLERWDKSRVRPGWSPGWRCGMTSSRRPSFPGPIRRRPSSWEYFHLSRAVTTDFAEIALEYLRRALVMRPSSPYTWRAWLRRATGWG